MPTTRCTIRSPGRAHGAPLRAQRGQLQQIDCKRPATYATTWTRQHTGIQSYLNQDTRNRLERGHIPASNLDLVLDTRTHTIQALASHALTWLSANNLPLSHDLQEGRLVVDVGEERLLLPRFRAVAGEVAANATIPALAAPPHAAPTVAVVVAAAALTSPCLPLSCREKQLAVAPFAAGLCTPTP